MSITPKAGFGTLLKIKTGESTYTVIPGVQSISGPSLSSNSIDASHMDQTGGYRTWVPNPLKDGGEISYDLLYDSTDSTQAMLLTALEDGTVEDFELHLSDNGTEIWAFSANITGFNLGAQMEDVLKVAVTMKIAGAIIRRES